MPQLSLIFGIYNLDSKFGRNSIWLFTIFYASCFVVTSETTGDAFRYASDLIQNHDNFEAKKMLSILTYQDGNTDLYQPIITYFISAFTKNYKILYIAFGVILGFFYSRNIGYLISGAKGRIGIIGIAFILLFALIIHIGMALNGVRMWTAAHVFVYGLINVYHLSNKKGYLFIAGTVLIHYSFILPVLVLTFFQLTNRFTSKYVYLLLFVLSFSVTKVNLSTGRSIVAYLPAVIANSAEAYVSEAHEVEQLTQFKARKESSQKHWSVAASRVSRLILTLLIIAVAHLYHNRFEEENGLQLILYYGMSLHSISNILVEIPSAGRFLIIAELIIFFYGAKVYFINRLSYSRRSLLFFGLPLMVLALLFPFRMFLHYPSFWLVFGNPVISLWSDEAQSIYDIFQSY